jgi:hypothetical protein
MGYCVGYWVNNFDLSPQLMTPSLLHNPFKLLVKIKPVVYLSYISTIYVYGQKYTNGLYLRQID